MRRHAMGYALAAALITSGGCVSVSTKLASVREDLTDVVHVDVTALAGFGYVNAGPALVGAYVTGGMEGHGGDRLEVGLGGIRDERIDGFCVGLGYPMVWHSLQSRSRLGYGASGPAWGSLGADVGLFLGLGGRVDVVEFADLCTGLVGYDLLKDDFTTDENTVAILSKNNQKRRFDMAYARGFKKGVADFATDLERGETCMFGEINWQEHCNVDRETGLYLRDSATDTRCYPQRQGSDADYCKGYAKGVADGYNGELRKRLSNGGFASGSYSPWKDYVFCENADFATRWKRVGSVDADNALNLRAGGVTGTLRLKKYRPTCTDTIKTVTGIALQRGWHESVLDQPVLFEVVSLEVFVGPDNAALIAVRMKGYDATTHAGRTSIVVYDVKRLLKLRTLEEPGFPAP